MKLFGEICLVTRTPSLVKMMKKDGEEAVCLPLCTLIDDSLRDC